MNGEYTKMSAKAILVFCAQALLVQSAFSQCTSRAAVDASGIGAPYGWAGPAIAPGFAYDGLIAPFGCDGFAAPALGLAPFAYEGCGFPYAYDGFGYDGLAGPFGYNGLAGWANRGYAYDGLYPSIAPTLDITPTTSGGLIVTSASAIPPTGISVISENAYEGILTVAGAVPFVGTTGMEGVLPTAGAGAINHACGNGVNAMVSEINVFAPGYAGDAYVPVAAITPAAIAPTAFGIAPAAYNGCGCGIVY